MISQKTFDELLRYVNHIHEATEKKTIKKDPTQVELILSCLSCLQEETWELASEIRKFTGMSFNKEKVNNFKMEHLQEERVDIFIVLLLLAKRVGIESLDEAILQKIRKNNERGY